MNRRHLSILGLGLFTAVVGLGTTSCKKRSFNTAKSSSAFGPGAQERMQKIGDVLKRLTKQSEALGLTSTTTRRIEWEGCVEADYKGKQDFKDVVVRAKPGFVRKYGDLPGFKFESREPVPTGQESITLTEYRMEAPYVKEFYLSGQPVKAKLRNRVRNYQNTITEEYPDDEELKIDRKELRDKSSRVYSVDANNRLYGFADVFNITNKMPTEWNSEIGEKNDSADIDAIKFFEWKESASAFKSSLGVLTAVDKHRLAILDTDVEVMTSKPILENALATLTDKKPDGAWLTPYFLTDDEVVARYKAQYETFMNAKAKAEEIEKSKGAAAFETKAAFDTVAKAEALLRDAGWLFLRHEGTDSATATIPRLRKKNQTLPDPLTASPGERDAFFQEFFWRTYWMNFQMAQFFKFNVRDASFTGSDGQVHNDPQSFGSLNANGKKVLFTPDQVTAALAGQWKQDLTRLARDVQIWVHSVAASTAEIYLHRNLANGYNGINFIQGYVRNSFKISWNAIDPNFFKLSNPDLVQNRPIPVQAEITIDRDLRMVPIDPNNALERMVLGAFDAMYSPPRLVCAMMKIPPEFAEISRQPDGTPDVGFSNQLFTGAGREFQLLKEVYNLRGEMFANTSASYMYDSKPRLNLTQLEKNPTHNEKIARITDSWALGNKVGAVALLAGEMANSPQFIFMLKNQLWIAANKGAQAANLGSRTEARRNINQAKEFLFTAGGWDSMSQKVFGNDSGSRAMRNFMERTGLDQTAATALQTAGANFRKQNREQLRGMFNHDHKADEPTDIPAE